MRSSARARDLIERGPVFVAPTVVLECEWVLRSLYGFSRSEVVGALEAFCGAPRVAVGEAAAVKRAFRLAERGLILRTPYIWRRPKAARPSSH